MILDMFDNELKINQLLEAFERLNGSYIMGYRINPDRLLDMIAVTCGNKLIKLFIKHASAAFIANRFRLKKCISRKKRFVPFYTRSS